MASELTQSQLESGISEIMQSSGYSEVRSDVGTVLDRVFEDEYGIVALAVFPDWSSLETRWPDAQGEFVDMLSEVLDRSEPKAWEGYLVLVTLESVTWDASRVLASIRRDINRVRKLVITGAEVPSLSFLSAALLPVLPIESREQEIPSGNLLDALPITLEQATGVEPRVTVSVRDAYLENETLMEAIHREVHG